MNRGSLWAFINQLQCSNPDWDKITDHLNSRDWGRKILRTLGYSSSDSQVVIAKALKDNDQQQHLLMGLVLKQKDIFDAQQEGVAAQQGGVIHDPTQTGCLHSLVCSIRSKNPRWNLIVNNIADREWGRIILVKLGYSLMDNWVIIRDLRENAEQQQRLLERVLQQKAEFDAQLGLPKVEKKEAEPLKPKPPSERAIFRAITRPIMKAAKKISRQEKSRLLAQVNTAEARKQEWLRPLMWEAAFNHEHNYRKNKRTRRLKQNFYRRAKDTACFDCGIQHARSEMTFDHLRDKDFTLGSLKNQGWDNTSWRRLHREIGKCDVVCRDCHDIREYLRGRMGWGSLDESLQKQVKSKSYRQRQALYQVITREDELSNLVDRESLRQVANNFETTIAAMNSAPIGDLRKPIRRKRASSVRVALSSSIIEEVWGRIKRRIQAVL